MNLPLLTFAPIWLPHWPAWRCTISRIFGFSRLHDTHFKEKLVVFWCCKTRQWFLTYDITMEICNDWRINEKRAKTARAALNTALKIKVNLEGFSCSNFFRSIKRSLHVKPFFLLYKFLQFSIYVYSQLLTAYDHDCNNFNCAVLWG